MNLPSDILWSGADRSHLRFEQYKISQEKDALRSSSSDSTFSLRMHNKTTNMLINRLPRTPISATVEIDV